MSESLSSSVSWKIPTFELIKGRNCSVSIVLEQPFFRDLIVSSNRIINSP